MTMNTIHPLAAALLAGMLVSGCTTTQCDPSQGGFVRGIGCASSGIYGQRQEEKRTVIAQEEREQMRLRTDYRAVQDEQAAVRAQREAAERRYAALERDLDAMRAQLRRTRTQNQGLEREIDDLQAQIDMLERDTYTPAPEKRMRLEELQRQKAALEAQVRMALER